MFEPLLSKVKNLMGYYPDSGPGDQTLLYGDDDLGFFGFVDYRTMPEPDELVTAMGVVKGTAIYPPGNNRGVWAKLVVRGQITFVQLSWQIYPAYTLSGITWNALYEAGVIYGVDGVGKYPTANPTNQKKAHWKDGVTYKVSTFEAGDVDPITNTAASDPSWMASDAYRIIEKFKEWKIGQGVLNATNIAVLTGWGSNTLASNTNVAASFGGGGRSLGLAKTSVAVTNGSGALWCPRLTVAKAQDYIFGVDRPIGFNTDIRPPVVTSSEVVADFVRVSPSELAYSISELTPAVWGSTVAF